MISSGKGSYNWLWSTWVHTVLYPNGPIHHFQIKQFCSSIFYTGKIVAILVAMGQKIYRGPMTSNFYPILRA